MIDTKAMPNLADIPRHQAKTHGSKTAMWFEGRETSFQDIDRRSNQIANGLLKSGVKPGDRVAYLGKNIDAYYDILFGVCKARGALAALNYRLAVPELVFVLNDCAANILFVANDYYDIAAEVAKDCPKLTKIIAIEGGHDSWTDYTDWCNTHSPTDPMLEAHPDDDVVQLYTSGTTGLPKGVQLTNANYLSLFEMASTQVWANYLVDDVVLNAMPLFHVAGVNVGVLSLVQGSTLIVLREVNPLAILELIEYHKINHMFIVPAVILMLCQYPGVQKRDFSSLKIVCYGASPITEGLLTQAMDLFGCQFAQVYGLTETGGTGTSLHPDDHALERNKLRSCGKPYPDIDIQCVDDDGQPVPQGEVGEITIRAGTVMKGYWNRADATQEAIKDGWFYTGDAGYFDDEGYLYIHDRVKDMIVSGGENVYPAEVENAIFSHPDVADVAVIGIPDPQWGEAVKAVIVPHSGKAISENDIIAYAKDKIASYKCPKSVDFQAEPLPRNPSGKVLRRQLREPYWKDQTRNVG